jgi:hypothetical protein
MCEQDFPAYCGDAVLGDRDDRLIGADYFDNRRWQGEPRLTLDDFAWAPTGVAVFPHMLVPEGEPSREWAERLYDVRRRTVVPRGGHFAPAEEPVLVAQDIATFFAALRLWRAGSEIHATVVLVPRGKRFGTPLLRGQVVQLAGWGGTRSDAPDVPGAIALALQSDAAVASSAPRNASSFSSATVTSTVRIRVRSKIRPTLTKIAVSDSGGRSIRFMSRPRSLRAPRRPSRGVSSQ